MPPLRPTLEQLARYSEAFNQSTTLGHFGMKVRFPDLDTVEVTLDPVRPEQRGGLGSDAVNGGVDAEGNECASATGLSRLSSLPWAAGGTPAVN